MPAILPSRKLCRTTTMGRFQSRNENVDGQGQGETKTEVITINTTQMSGLHRCFRHYEYYDERGSFDLLQQQAQHQKQRQETKRRRRPSASHHLFFTHLQLLLLLLLLYYLLLLLFLSFFKSSFFEGEEERKCMLPISLTSPTRGSWVIVLGASGDLASKKLFPSLNLHSAGFYLRE